MHVIDDRAHRAGVEVMTEVVPCPLLALAAVHPTLCDLILIGTFQALRDQDVAELERP